MLIDVSFILVKLILKTLTNKNRFKQNIKAIQTKLKYSFKSSCTNFKQTATKILY